MSTPEIHNTMGLESLHTESGPPPYEASCETEAGRETSDEGHRQQKNIMILRAWIRENCTTVARGPPHVPMGSWKYSVDWSAVFDRPAYPGLWGIFPWRCLSGKLPLAPCHCVACRLKKSLSRIGGKMHHRWTASPAATAQLTPSDQAEHLVHESQDWTRNWEWAVTLRAQSHPDPLSELVWQINVRILAKDLPRQLRRRQFRWEDHRKSLEEGRVVAGSSTSDGSYTQYLSCHGLSSPVKPTSLDSCRWVAEAFLIHRNEEWHKSNYFGGLLSADSITMAEIDQRTVPGRCKKVVAYHRGIAYGNDLTGQKIEPWEPTLLARFSEFIEPLLPSGK